ncbi:MULTISPECIES: hypothetical protein [unclassified Cupriavidus]|uniref:hypothetical protein n=1 Tax=unclassified Cupriavidus TaxID=2640874 RepID=UPI0010FA348E|nr:MULTISPECIES: hypothetical protein [unclassified Cupriavidus]MWL86533.1 hypothetical protein [Cupriavidus sp. SW-Y-13]
MLARPHLRSLVAGTLAVIGLVGAIATSHAQVAFWQRAVDNPVRAVRLGADSWDVAAVRAENRQHVQQQIDRMEQRARNDDRLSGRPPEPGNRDERARQAGGPDRNTGDNGAMRGTDVRPTNVGPGWQARGRDGGR